MFLLSAIKRAQNGENRTVLNSVVIIIIVVVVVAAAAAAAPDNIFNFLERIEFC